MPLPAAPVLLYSTDLLSLDKGQQWVCQNEATSSPENLKSHFIEIYFSMKIKYTGEKIVIYKTRNACGQRSLTFLLQTLRRWKVEVGGEMMQHQYYRLLLKELSNYSAKLINDCLFLHSKDQIHLYVPSVN